MAVACVCSSAAAAALTPATRPAPPPMPCPLRSSCALFARAPARPRAPQRCAAAPAPPQHVLLPQLQHAAASPARMPRLLKNCLHPPMYQRCLSPGYPPSSKIVSAIGRHGAELAQICSSTRTKLANLSNSGEPSGRAPAAAARSLAEARAPAPSPEERSAAAAPMPASSSSSRLRETRATAKYGRSASEALRRYLGFASSTAVSTSSRSSSCAPSSSLVVEKRCARAVVACARTTYCGSCNTSIIAESAPSSSWLI
eukprot:6191029-Pleurochrysis_carterae.AAC.6